MESLKALRSLVANMEVKTESMRATLKSKEPPISPTKTSLKSRKSSSEIIDHLSTDSEDDLLLAETWLFPKERKRDKNALQEILKEVNNLTEEEKLIQETAILRLCLPHWSLKNEFPADAQKNFLQKENSFGNRTLSKSNPYLFEPLQAKIEATTVDIDADVNSNIPCDSNKLPQEPPITQTQKSQIETTSNRSASPEQNPIEISVLSRTENLPKNTSNVSKRSISVERPTGTLSAKDNPKTSMTPPRRTFKRSPLPSQQAKKQELLEKKEGDKITSTLNVTPPVSTRITGIPKPRAVSKSRVAHSFGFRPRKAK